MPFLVRKLEINIVEQNTAQLSAISSVKVGIGYGGIYFALDGFIAITQNFDQVISVEEFPTITFFGLKSNDYAELKISYSE